MHIPVINSVLILFSLHFCRKKGFDAVDLLRFVHMRSGITAVFGNQREGWRGPPHYRAAYDPGRPFSRCGTCSNQRVHQECWQRKLDMYAGTHGCAINTRTHTRRPPGTTACTPHQRRDASVRPLAIECQPPLTRPSVCLLLFLLFCSSALLLLFYIKGMESLCPTFPGGTRMVLLALTLGLMQQLTGTEAILYYAPQILAGEASPIDHPAVFQWQQHFPFSLPPLSWL